MTILQLPLSIGDLEHAWLKEDYREGWGKLGKAIAQRNKVFNPSLEVSLASNAALNLATLTRDTTEFFVGVASAKLVTPGTITNEGINFSALRLMKGINNRASIRVKGSIGQTLRVLIAQQKADASFALASTSQVLTGGWDLVSSPTLFFNDQDSGATPGSVQVATVGGALATTFYVDAAIISEGTSAPSYFDGSTADGPIYSYDWEGTPHNSSSIKWSAEPRLADDTVDVNARSVGYLEHAYWAKRSGLLPKEQYSIDDHKRAYLKATVVSSIGESLNDLWLSYLRQNSGLPNPHLFSAADNELAFYKAQLGL